MAWSLGILKLKSFAMTLASSMNSHHLTHPQQNGVVERKNRTLITLARAMLDNYGISQRFWAEAINTACHASNRVYLHRFLKKTPYELLILPGLQLQILHLQEKEAPRQVSK